MTTATVLIDSQYMARPRETGNPGRTASEPRGEVTQQRFADVLPLAQAASERPAEKTAAESAPAEKRSSDRHAATEPAELPERRVREDDAETTAASQEVADWLLVGTVSPVTHRQMAADAAVAPVAGPPESLAAVTASSDQNASPTPASQAAATSQTSQVQGQPGASSVAGPLQGTMAVQVPAPGEPVRGTPQLDSTPQPQQPQQASGPAQEAVVSRGEAEAALAANAATADVSFGGKEAAPSAAASGGQLPSAPQASQGTSSGAVAQAAPRDGQAGPAQATGESAPGSARPQTAEPASPSDGAGSTTLLEPTSESAGRTQGIEESSRQGEVQPRIATSRATNEAAGPVGSEKMSQGHESAGGDRQDRPSERPAPTVGEDVKARIVAVEGYEAAVVGAKEGGAGTAETHVSGVGEAGVLSQRVAAPGLSQAGADTPTTPGSAAAPARSPTQSVGDQILDSLRASVARGDREVVVRLEPPELGMVLVRFQERGNQLTGTLEVSNGETRREIEQALPQVVRALQEAGAYVRRVEVVTSDPSERGPGGEHLQQETGPQHQGNGQGRESSQTAGQMRWARNAGEPGVARRPAVPNEPHATVPDGRIDLLL